MPQAPNNQITATVSYAVEKYSIVSSPSGDYITIGGKIIVVPPSDGCDVKFLTPVTQGSNSASTGPYTLYVTGTTNTFVVTEDGDAGIAAGNTANSNYCTAHTIRVGAGAGGM